MNRVLIILLFAITKSFSQIQVELYFKDGCENYTRKLEYEISDLNSPGILTESINSKVSLPSRGTYLVSSSFLKNDKVSSFNLTVEIKDFHFFVDTLLIPRIKFTTDSLVQSRYWDYFNCDRLCNGQEIDFYPNGEKRLEGSFNKGKPIHLVEYRNDGTKERSIWYREGYLEYERIEYFDKAGKLSAYATFRKEKNEIIKRVYNAKGALLNREVVSYKN